MVQSDRSNSVWHNDIIITWCSWLVLCISSQWASACCSSCSVVQKPSTFPSSTCIDLLWGDSCILYMRVILDVICTAAAFITCSQQHVMNVLTVASVASSSSSIAYLPLEPCIWARARKAPIFLRLQGWASGQFSRHSSNTGRASGLFYASPYFYILDIHQLVMKKNCRSGGKETTLVHAATTESSLTVFRVSATEGFCVQTHAID